MSTEISLTRADGGTVLPVRVVPRSSRTEIDGVHDGAVRIRLKAPPVDGAANKALCGFLAKLLGVPKRSVAIRSGDRSRTKSVLIAGLSPADVRRRLGIDGG